MMNRMMSALSRLLYPRQLSMDPGAFEAFLTEVADLEQIDRRSAPVARSPRG